MHKGIFFIIFVTNEILKPVLWKGSLLDSMLSIPTLFIEIDFLY